MSTGTSSFTSAVCQDNAYHTTNASDKLRIHLSQVRESKTTHLYQPTALPHIYREFNLGIITSLLIKSVTKTGTEQHNV
jgi:hypothetical protein